MAFWTDFTLDLPLEVEDTFESGAVDETRRLIERCLCGETAAYAALYQRHAPYIYRLIYGLLRHREDAEEVLQDTFEYAFRRLSRYDAAKSAFRTWLYSIAISRTRNKRRRKWLPTFSLSQTAVAATDQDQIQIRDDQALLPDEEIERKVRNEQIWEALGELSEKLRETAILRYYGGLTYQEIGQVLTIPSKTAESRMRLAHQALKTALEGKL